MTSSLEELHSRSTALGSRLGLDEALEINQAILKRDPDSEIAATRLGIGLLNAERADEAVLVFEAALRMHPDNPVVTRRLEQAKRDIARGKVPPPRRRGGASPATRGIWLKAVPQEEGWTVNPGELSWVSDAGIIDKHGDRVYREDGKPAGEPSWHVGDAVGLCFGKTKRIPLLVEVAQRPYFDPAFVASERGSAADGERWPWVTMVRGLTALSLDEAPTLDDLQIAGRSVQQRTRKLLADVPAKLLMSALAPDPDPVPAG